MMVRTLRLGAGWRLIDVLIGARSRTFGHFLMGGAARHPRQGITQDGDLSAVGSKAEEGTEFLLTASNVSLSSPCLLPFFLGSINY